MLDVCAAGDGEWGWAAAGADVIGVSWSCCVVTGAAAAGSAATGSCGLDSGCFSTAELGAELPVAVEPEDGAVAVEIADGCVWLLCPLLSLIGEVGESRSLEPPESFVLFFFRKPRVGIKRESGANTIYR